MRIFSCDSCGAEFPQPLDQEVYKDEHGVLQTYDLCAPCRKKLSVKAEMGKKDFFGKKKGQTI